MPDLEVEAKQRLREAEVEANLCNVPKDVMSSQQRANPQPLHQGTHRSGAT